MSVVIGGPGPNQVIRPGNLTVTGTATGQGAPEPVAIQSVTVNGIGATLTGTTGSVTVGFTATLRMPAWVPTVTITATAVDELGFRTAASVTVRMGGGWVGSWSELYTDNDNLSSLRVAANADGRLEVFGVKLQPGAAIWHTWHTWQTQPGAAWGGSWSELYSDKDTLTALDVARNADGRLEVFGVDEQGHIWHTWQTQPGSWDGGSWSQLYSDNESLHTLRVVANADGRLEVFGVDEQAHIWHTWQTQPGSWDGGSWSQLYSDNYTQDWLSVAANADGRLEVFGVDEQAHVWHTSQTQPGSWEGGSWSQLYSDNDTLDIVWLSVASNADGRLEVFGLKGPTFQLWHTWQTQPNGGWVGSWSQLPSIGNGLWMFAVARNGDGRLEVVAVDNGSLNIWHIRQTQPGSWDGASWGELYSDNDTLGAGIDLISQGLTLDMARNADGRLEVFGINNSGHIWHTWRDWDVPFEATPTGTIPSVIGLDPSTAMANIQAAGFAYSSADNPVKGTLQPYVEYQNPDGGTTALLGSAVDVTIAVQVPATVPNVIDLSPSTAMANIQAAGFTYSPKTDKVEGNFTPHVEDQRPLGGTTALQGSAVNVTIALPVKGPPP
jgi:hypothetical protein